MKFVLVKFRFSSKRRVHLPTHVTGRCLVLKARCDMKRVNVVRSTRPHGSSGLHCWKQTMLAAGPKFTLHNSSIYPELLSFLFLNAFPKLLKAIFSFVIFVSPSSRLPSVRLNLMFFRPCIMN